MLFVFFFVFFFFQAEDGIRDLVRSRGLGDVYKRQFMHFAAENVDVAVIEVGLGGRLDATNVLTPEVSVLSLIHI